MNDPRAETVVRGRNSRRMGVHRWPGRATTRAAVATLEMLETRWLLSTATWVGAAGGNWNVGSNWSTGTVPGGGDTAILLAGASVDVSDSESCGTLNTAVGATLTVMTNASLGLGGGTVNGTLIDSGTISGPGSSSNQVVLAGNTTFDTSSGVASGYFFNSGTLTLYGGVFHGAQFSNSGTIDANDSVGLGLNTTLSNLANGIINISDGGVIGTDTYGTGGSFPILVNYGKINKIGTSTGGFEADTNNGAMTLEDIGGTIDAQGGTLQIPTYGQFDGTTFQAAAGASITMGDANNPYSISYLFNGTITGSGAGTLQLQASGAQTGTPGVLNTSATAAAVFNFPAGFAQVTGMYFAQNSYNIINQGTLTYTGSTTDGSCGLDNKGTINITGTGDFDVNRNGTFTNDTTGILDFESDAGVTNDNGNPPGFINEGLIEKTGGTGTSTLGDGTANVGLVNESGTFDVESGTLDIANGGSDFAFTVPNNGITAAPGATFALGAAGQNPRIYVQGNLTISGGGTFALLGGYLYGPNGGDNQDTSSPATLDFTGDEFLVNGGGFNDNTNLINQGDIDFQSGDLGTLLNKGTVTLGSGVVVDSGAFINAAGGTLDSGTSDGIYRQGNNGNVQNAGTFIMSPGAGNTFDMSGTEISNTGTLIFGPGTSNLPWLSNGYDYYPGLFPSENSIPAGSTFILQSGATVTIDTSPSLNEIDGTVIMNAGSSFPAIANLNTITGEFQVLSGESFSTAGNLTNNGTLSVGGTFTVNGNYTQAAEQYVQDPPTPTLDFQIAAAPGSSGAPNFTVTGNTSLAGDLTASYASSFTTTGGTWTVATFDNPATGSFASTAGTGPNFTPTVTASQITLTGGAYTGTGGSSGTGGNGGTGGTSGGSVDLDVTAVNAPANFTSGENETLTWTVQNNGTSATSGSWEDSVYLSSDQTLSSDDVLLGRVSESSSVATGASYTGTLTTDMPAVLPGTYYVIVVVDSRQTLSESSYSNNTAVSAAATETVPALTLGQTTTGSVSASQQQLYSLSLQSGQAIKLSATFATALEAELLVGVNAVPTTTSNIAAATDPNQTSASLLITAPVAGTYYILVDGRPDVSGSQSFTLTPTILPYGPGSVTPTAAAAVYETTITVQGNGFTPTTTVSLVQGSNSVAAAGVTYVNAQTLYATFVLYGVTPGVYDLQTSQPDGTTATLSNAFTVNPFTGATGAAADSLGQIEFQFTVPAYVRVGGTAVATLTYENVGGTEVDAPLFEIEGTNAEFQLPGMTTFDANTIDVIGIASTGPAGVLEPGQSGSVQITYEQTPGSAAHTISNLKAYLINPSDTVDWDAAKSALKPSDQSQAAWDTTWANFETLVGKTVNSYQQELSAVANQLSEQGYRTYDVAQYINQILRVAGNFGSINQADTLTSFGYGQIDPYDVSLTFDSAGNAAVGANNAYRYFLLQSNGTFVNEDAPTDAGMLAKNSDGTYTLTEADGSKTVFNSDGSLNSFYDANGNKITVTLTNGLVTQLTNVMGQTITLIRNSAGMVTSITDPEGRVETFTYDTYDNLTSISGPAGTTTYVYADPASHLITQIDNANGTEELYGYDSFGRINSESAAGGADKLTISYDNVGDETITDALNRTFIGYRSGSGGLASVEDPLGNLLSETIGSAGAPALITNPDGTSTEVATNAAGDITAITAATGATVTLAYNADHDLTSITDPDNHATTFTYDANGNLLTSTDANNQTTTYTYTAQGLLASSSSAAGRVINDTYDSLGRLTGQTFSDGTTASYTYDSHNNLLTATNAAGTETFTYDSADRLTKVTYSDGLSLTFVYNSNGQLSSTVDQSGATENYQYNAEGQLDEVTDAAGNTIAAYSYDAAGDLIRTDLGNGTYTVYGYDADGRENSIINYAADGSVQSSFLYVYNADSRITSITTLAGTTTYTYDANGQLTSATLPDGTTENWTYDASGNRISTTDTGGTTAYTTNNLNQYTAVGGTTYTYDADGNLISSITGGVTTTYTYNVEEQLTSITTPTSTTTFTYDALGNRVAEKVNGITTELLVNPLTGELAGEFDTSGNVVAEYQYGLGLIGESLGSVTAASDYYQFDIGGNVSALTDSTGTVLNTYTYSPFGEVAASTGATANPFTFDGRDSVQSVGDGNYLTLTRLYSSTLGRFTQRDPLSFDGGDANLYRYVGNDPVNKADPTGTIAGFDTSALNESYLRNFFENTLDAARADITSVTTSGSQVFESSLVEGETFVSNLSANTGTVFSEYGTMLVDEGIPAVFTEVETVATTAAPAVTATAETAGVISTAVPVITGTVLVGTTYALTHPQQVYDRLSNLFDYSGDQGITRQAAIAKLMRTQFGQLLASQGTNVAALPLDQLEDYLQEANQVGLGSTESRSAQDPNDITGPAGYGSAGFITDSAILPYQITFTNEATASAPAAVVTITEQISSNLDWSTFAFGTLGFGSNTFTPPAGVQQYSTTFALSSTITLDIVASFDAATGVATWTFTTIDNATGDVPSDPSLGFLPPDLTSPEGEGFVNYTVKPLATLATGATVSAQASIVFDNNAAIATSTITNTIDAVAPTSTITALPATANSTYFNLTWSGSDDSGGSGIASYTIYVSEDGGAYTPYLSNTTATSAQFIGTPGHSYSFYSIATDNAGNQQAVPAAAQATTTIPAIARTINFGGKTKATYTDSTGHTVTITLSSGTGVLSFLSNGNTDPISMVLSGTTAKSTLTVKVSGGEATLGAVTINGSLKSFTAPDANFTETFTITGTLESLTLGDETLTKSAIDIEGAGVATTIKIGTVHDLTLTTASPIKSLTATAWTAGQFNADAITAPSIGTLTVKGDFDPVMNLTAAGLDLKTEKISGNITGGSLTAAGSVGTISANSVAAGWTSTIDGPVNTLQTKGDFDGAFNASALTTAKIGGNLAGATLTFTGSSKGYALKTLTVGKSASNTLLAASANVGNITVGGIANSRILIGVASTATTLPTDASAFTASDTLASFTTKGTSPFSNTIIAAATIDKSKLADVTTNNNGIPFGLAAKTLDAFTLDQSGAKPIIYTQKQSTAVLANLPGDLRVEIL